MLRAIGILLLDVLVFMGLIMFGAMLQQFDWSSFLMPFYFLPAFLYVWYRVSSEPPIELREILLLFLTLSVTMGVAFDVIGLQAGSPIATVGIIVAIGIAREFFPRRRS